ncbi:MAG: serine hydrolase domain-containing protein [Lacunisphaera sp.]
MIFSPHEFIPLVPPRLAAALAFCAVCTRRRLAAVGRHAGRRRFFRHPGLDTLHQSLGRLVDNGTYAGYVVLLARDGKVVDWRTHGWQDVATRTPMQKDSIFALHSMTKLVTTTAILMLLEEGKLQLNDPVEKYLPALKDRQVLTGGTADAPVLVPASHPITLHELLTHTAGYFYAETWSADSPVEIELMNRAKPWEATDLADFVQRVAAVPLHQQPGTKFRYGIHTDLLGAIVEKISGQRLDRFFADRIFTPLGLRDTGFWVPADKRSRMATLYAHDASGKLTPASTRPDPDARHGLLSGGGGLYSTAADYARYSQMLLNGGQLDGVRLLGRKTVELMTQNHLALLADPHPFAKAEQGFGLGVRVITDLGASPTLGSVGTFAGTARPPRLSRSTRRSTRSRSCSRRICRSIRTTFSPRSPTATIPRSSGKAPPGASSGHLIKPTMPANQPRAPGSRRPGEGRSSGVSRMTPR